MQHTLVTIIAEDVLEPRLTELVMRLGATGYTASPCRGEGSRGLRTGSMPGGNVRIEVIVSTAVADAIVARLASDYFPHYAVIAWRAEVGVVRGDKYAPTP
jgi:hypothetical protein